MPCLARAAVEGKPADEVTDADKKASSTCKGFPVGPRAAALEKWLNTDDSKVCSHVLLAGREAEGGDKAKTIAKEGMDEWMDGWMDGWMSEWMDERMDE